MRAAWWNILSLASILSGLSPVLAFAASSALPLLQDPVDMLVVPGTTARQVLFASDGDGEQLQFTKLFGPDFMSVTTRTHVGAITSAVMSFAPGAADIGTFDIGVQVADGASATDQAEFTLSTVVPIRPASGSVDFEIPHFEGQRRTIDPFVDPGTGIVFRGATSNTEVGLVKSSATSCVSGQSEDQKLGGAQLGDDGIGLTTVGCRAEFGAPLDPPCTVSVDFHTGAGAVIELSLYDETGQVIGSASGTAGPPLQPCFSFAVPPAITKLTATSQQRVSYAVMREVQTNYVLAFDNFEYSSAPPPVTAQVDIDPDVINLASRARWVTAYIELSSGSPETIDLPTLRLAGSVSPDAKVVTLADHDQNGIKDLMVKFSREELDPLLTLGVNELKLTGSLVTGEHLEATDEVRVIDPAGSHLAVSATPNPIHPSGVLSFTTQSSGRARLAVFDVRGSLVRVLMDTPSLAPGSHSVTFDGMGRRGQPLPTGVYFYRLETGEGLVRGRIVVSR
jgi:hypothetical protein